MSGSQLSIKTHSSSRLAITLCAFSTMTLILSTLRAVVSCLPAWVHFLGDEHNCGEPIIEFSLLSFSSSSSWKLLLVWASEEERNKLDEKLGKPQLQQIHDALLFARASKITDGICKQLLWNQTEQLSHAIDGWSGSHLTAFVQMPHGNLQALGPGFISVSDERIMSSRLRYTNTFVSNGCWQILWRTSEDDRTCSCNRQTSTCSCSCSRSENG